MSSVAVEFDTQLYSSYNTANNDTCVSISPNCNGVDGYTDKKSTLGFSSKKKFQNGVQIVTTANSDDTKHAISKIPTLSAGTFVSPLTRNVCYLTPAPNQGTYYYIRSDGTPCHISMELLDLCRNNTIPDTPSSQISNGIEYPDPAIPECIAADGNTKFLGYINPIGFTGSNAIHSSTNTETKDNCGSTGANCNGQSGYTGDSILGYVSQKDGSFKINTSKTGNGDNTDKDKPPPPPESTPVWKKWWFWAIIGGSVLLLIIIIILIVVLSKRKKK